MRYNKHCSTFLSINNDIQNGMKGRKQAQTADLYRVRFPLPALTGKAHKIKEIPKNLDFMGFFDAHI